MMASGQRQDGKATRLPWTLAPEFVLRVRRDEPLARHTSWHVGGPADLWFEPRDREDLAAFLRSLPADMPVHWIGLGSNLLVRDGGLRGAAISTQGALSRLDRIAESTVHCDAGVPCARIAKQCVKWGLGSAEFLAGIPGTLGGALAMNAGAFGGETWRHVLELDVMARNGTRRARAPAEYQISYRRVIPPVPDEWFLGARLQFDRKTGVSNTEIRELLARRREAQPIGEWSCGSVFTNPPGDHAARLIEACGLKGLQLGGASVSTKHANFFINNGVATATDMENLIATVQATVLRQAQVQLVPEVRVIGEPLAVLPGAPS